MSPDSTKHIASKDQLIAFVRELAADARANGATWENSTLESFFDAMSAWLDDADGFYANRSERIEAQSPWRVVADALAAARIYE